VVSAQEYENRYESIYHLKKFDDPTRREVSVVVPADKDDPVSESAEPVFRTADWHEREAYDLIGIEYDDHPDLRRILLPETWQGHPSRWTTTRTGRRSLVSRSTRTRCRSTTRTLSPTRCFSTSGRTTPATHGVLHLKTVLDGEQVVDVEPDIGYLHRSEEQMAQSGTYRHQIMPYPDRWDYISAGLLNEWAYARAAEDLADIEVPEYAQVIRTMGAEMCRIAAHMLALATFALDTLTATSRRRSCTPSTTASASRTSWRI